VRKHNFSSHLVLLVVALTLITGSSMGQDSGSQAPGTPDGVGPVCTCPVQASVTYFPQCDSGVVLNITPPIIGTTITAFVTSAFPDAPLVLGVSTVPAGPVITPGGCSIDIDFLTVELLGPFSTNAAGAWTMDLIVVDPSFCGLTRRIQAALLAPGGPDGDLRLSNAIQTVKGCGDPDNGLGKGGFCSYTQGGYAGNGVPGQLFDANFTTVFAGGLEVGDYDTASGNSAPNGLRWEGNATGRDALKNFLPGGGPSGAIASDQLNPGTSFGGGGLAYQTVALTLNIGFSNAGLIGGVAPGWAGLIYIEAGSSLSGMSISQILGAANDALSGAGLPAGYSHGTLADVIENLNESFDNCVMSDWANTHIFNP
jgi:hypothetical protein